MTTILADARLGVMVSDSSISDGERVWLGRKVFRCKGALIGFSGEYAEGNAFVAWWKAGRPAKHPPFTHSYALVLDDTGLWIGNGSCTLERVPGGVETIGSGAKAAICTYEALGWSDPVRAVKIVCKRDAGSRAPVRVYKLKP